MNFLFTTLYYYTKNVLVTLKLTFIPLLYIQFIRIKCPQEDRLLETLLKDQTREGEIRKVQVHFVLQKSQIEQEPGP